MKTLRIFRIILDILGAVALIGILVDGGVLLWGLSHKARDGSFVVGQAGANLRQHWSVLHSYQSGATFNGDHLEYYCIQLQKFIPKPDPGPENSGWHPGPESDPLFAKTLRFALTSAKSEGGKCLPSAEEADSQSMRLMFFMANFDDKRPAGANIFIYNPKKKQLYYMSYDRIWCMGLSWAAHSVVIG